MKIIKLHKVFIVAQNIFSHYEMIFNVLLS